MSDILHFNQVTATSVDLVGGKGLSLGLTAAAGLPVPPGFCVTASAYRRHRDGVMDAALAAALLEAYSALGRGVVAVRSSATAEDGVATSFAGQQETILGVEGDEELKAAVERCWRSLHTERAKAYRVRQGIDDAGLAMAVVVQRLIDAEVAGVMFTRDPLDPSGTLMRIESAWGIGETVVSGRVTPDRFQVNRAIDEVTLREPGDKAIQVTRRGEEPVPAERRRALSLTDEQLTQLANLGRRVEEFYGDARDIEWAIAAGRVWLLQARPITTAGAAEREQVRRDTIDRLAKLVEPGGTVWSRTNLVEVLSEPTPMTWMIVSNKLLSGGGGTGGMYRDFGFRPDPALASLSAYDLIGGRPYLNLSREPRLESSKPLSGYPLDDYKSTPERALNPKRNDPRGLRKWLALPGMMKVALKISAASDKFAAEFRDRIIPAFAADVDHWRTEDLAQLESPRLLKLLDAYIDRTLVEFARESLKPTLLAQFSWQTLEQQMAKSLGAERATSLLAGLTHGAKPDADADLAAGIRDLAEGKLTRDEFLTMFGHRGANEMELAAPRWAEKPEGLATLPRLAHAPVAEDDTQQLFDRVCGEAKWNSVQIKSLSKHFERLRTYLGLREAGKHHFMRGYAEIRRVLLEFDRRFKLDGGVFFLEPGELNELTKGTEFTKSIAARRQTRALELSMEMPAVIIGNDLEAIGRPLPLPTGAEMLHGVPLSAGIAEGPALVLDEPMPANVEPGYILVCPSTDPAWVPLFVNAKALVMESGGTLSHGAIVAREFGLPAVAGLPDVQRRLRTGQRLRVDGGRGLVSILAVDNKETRPN